MQPIKQTGRGTHKIHWLGITLFCLFIFVLTAKAAAPFRVLHSFAGSPNDGALPTYGTSLAASGNMLFGVTQNGGQKTNGVLFKMSSNGSGYTILHHFNGYSFLFNLDGSKNDGAIPTGTPLVVGSTIYGMTTQGGSNALGTIYRINTDGSGFEVLYHFGFDNGHVPEGSLILSGSTLFGMTGSGGSNFSQGVAFRIETNGTGYRVLHHFRPGLDDGAHGGGSLVLGGSTLYGMTRLGGYGGQGILFRMNTEGGSYQILHTFTGVVTDGASPFDSLILEGDTLYGTTANGGANNVGTVFKIGTNGIGFQILHSFSLGEGWQPNGNVTLVDSKLYGMTRTGGGGGLGAGVLFTLGTDGTGYEVLHVFKFEVNGQNGVFPFGSLLFANSSLYGMASLGGTTGQGCVFSYSLGGGGGGTGSPELSGRFSSFKEACKTKRGVFGCTLSAALTVDNAGTGSSVPMRLRYFISTDETFDAGDVQSGEKTLGKIKPAKRKKLRFKTKTTESTLGRYLLAVDDTGKVVAATVITLP